MLTEEIQTIQQRFVEVGIAQNEFELYHYGLIAFALSKDLIQKLYFTWIAVVIHSMITQK